MNDMPISTKWTMDSVDDMHIEVIKSVIFLSVNLTKGTGFRMNGGYIFTNYHVIGDSDPDKINSRDGCGNVIRIGKIYKDKELDLAILVPWECSENNLTIGDNSNIKIGTQVCTWGFPLGYNGPSPLLSMGYISGFRQNRVGSKNYRRIIVNGAFNSGNSGGPLINYENGKVIGMVVSKHTALEQRHLDAIKFLSMNNSGLIFTGRDINGNEFNVTESQIVADILDRFKESAQTVIGEAIAIEDIMEFMKKVI